MIENAVASTLMRLPVSELSALRKVTSTRSFEFQYYNEDYQVNGAKRPMLENSRLPTWVAHR